MSKLMPVWDDLVAQLQSIADLNTQVFKSTSPTQLIAQLKGAIPPAVGVVYEGMRSDPEPGSNTKQGLMTHAVFGLYLVVNSVAFSPTTDKSPITVDLLDSMREKIKERKSPAGHKWQFLVEVFADSNEKHEIWVQRWQTQVVIH